MNRLIVILLIIYFGCNQSRNDTSKINEEESDSTLLPSTDNSISSTKKIDSEKSEQFDSFFENYTTDSIFQVDRTIFPVKQKYREIGEDEPTSTNVKQSHWGFYTFDYHDSLATRQVDAYTQTINYGIDTTRLEIRGVDNGIFIDYNFVNKDGHWFLVSIYNYSN